MNVLDDAHLIIKEAIDRAMPDNAVKAALGSVSLPHKVGQHMITLAAA